MSNYKEKAVLELPKVPSKCWGCPACKTLLCGISRTKFFDVWMRDNETRHEKCPLTIYQVKKYDEHNITKVRLSDNVKQHIKEHKHIGITMKHVEREWEEIIKYFHLDGEGYIDLQAYYDNEVYSEYCNYKTEKSYYLSYCFEQVNKNTLEVNWIDIEEQNSW